MGSVPTPKTSLPIVFGAGVFGDPAKHEGVRVKTVEDAKAMLDVFQAHGHTDVDVARIYASGSSETLLAATDWVGRGLNVHTKLYPTKGKPFLAHLGTPYSYSPADVRAGLKASLEALNTPSLDLWILYAPDRQTPLEDTLREVNKLHEEGFFKRLGISNYMAWEVAHIVDICDRNNWIRPTVYQGVYNLLFRSLEPELIPCLRANGISLFAGQPLAGGLLTARYRRDTSDAEIEPGSRFDPNLYHGKHHRVRYWNEKNFDALHRIREVGAKYGFSEVQCAMRWLQHHSLLRKEKGDMIIIGGSNTQMLEENLITLEQGALPEEVVEVLNGIHKEERALLGVYFH